MGCWPARAPKVLFRFFLGLALFAIALFAAMLTMYAFPYWP